MAGGRGKKRASLTMEEKCLIVEWDPAGGLTANKVLQRLIQDKGKTVSRACISLVLKQKDRWNGMGNPKARRERPSKWPKLEEALRAWFEQTRATGVPISDELLLAKARMIAEGASVEDFKGTNGRLHGFKTRHNIRSKGLHGEAADADPQGVPHSQHSLPALITQLGYKKEDVFNFDETGLFFKAEPKRTLLQFTRGS